ncbi:MAG TPA: tetratricopeptide repeat protein [Chitinophagales bacterium]|nr:tetratricopeptide repeat protein [Chitinophagales bacterium]
MKTKQFFIILLSLLLCNGLLKAQGNLDMGWSAFYKNNRSEARNYFTKALSESASKSEASLGLALIEEVDGKNDAAFNHFQVFYKTAANPYPYLFALWHTPVVFAYTLKLKDDRIEFLKSIIDDPKANGTLKAMAHSALGKHYAASNSISKSNEEFAKIGSVAVWQLAGEFENISESGFDKNFDPVSHPEEAATFINKVGAKVKWFEMAGNRNDKWVDFAYHFFIDNSIIYAQTFVSSPVDQQLQLRIGTSGSLKAWVNDALVFTESKERNNDLDTYIAAVKLNKGNNRILLQIGSSEIESSNFLVRLTDDDGNPVAGLKAVAKAQPYNQATTADIKPVRVFAEEYFESKVKEQPEKIIHYLMLASAYLRNDKAYEARKVLLQAQEKEPECSYIKTKLIEAYYREGNETDANIGTEWLKEHDADNLISLNLFYNEEVKKENYEEAEKIVDKITGIYGEDEETMHKRINLLANMKKRDQTLVLIQEAYKKYPTYYDFIVLKSAVEQNVNKNFGAGIDVLKKYLKDNYSSDAQVKLSDAYLAKGDLEAGLDAYSDQLLHEPYSVGTIYRLGLYYYKITNYTTAEKYFKNALSIAPYVNYFWAALAKCYEDMGRKQDAIAAYEKAIEYKPTSYDARESLRNLYGKPDVFSYFPQPDVYNMIKKAPAAAEYPEDNSLILGNEVQKVVYGGGASEEKHIMVVKVFNQQGIDIWKEYWIESNSMQTYLIEKAEVVKVNGSKVEAETNDSHIVFTTLEAGDAIHITYRLKNYLTGKLAPHFWEEFYFSHWYPYLSSKYTLLIDPSIKFRYEFSQDKIEPVVTKKDEFDLYTWEKTNQPSITSEDKMPQIKDVANLLYLSSFPDWTYISNWYYDLASTKAKSDFEVSEVVTSLFREKKNLTELQKANVIYDYIVTNISYSSVSFLQSGLIPQKASKVINTKIGDCKDVATLFVAMCKEAGIQADWVLVNTRDGGSRQNILPSIEFNHCIARLHADGKNYFIELTSNALPFNTFYNELKNAEALPITGSADKGITLLHLNPDTRYKNIVARESDVTLSLDEITVKKSNIKTGVLAAYIRDTYRDIGEQEQKKNMQEAISGDYPNLRLMNLSFTNLKSTSDTVQYEFIYKATDALTEVGGMKLLNIPWSEKAQTGDFVFSESRKYPIDLWNWTANDNETETIVLHIPAGLQLSEIPKQVNFTCPVADYTLKYKSEPGKLTISRQLSYRKDLVELTEISVFRDFYKKVVAADTKPLAFK